jgi:NAD(P)-dependent dehydrogenase (short-subunit alcohol dehydrogenase family)
MVKEHGAKFGTKGARIVSISPGIIMTPMADLQSNYLKL